jgi:hypothetical protein
VEMVRIKSVPVRASKMAPTTTPAPTIIFFGNPEAMELSEEEMDVEYDDVVLEVSVAGTHRKRGDDCFCFCVCNGPACDVLIGQTHHPCTSDSHTHRRL